MKKQFVFVHISGWDNDISIISVCSSLVDSMRRAAVFMKRHKYDDDYKFHAIEKWQINSKSETPKEVWEYERKRVNQPKQWIKLKELKGKFWL